MTEMSLRFPPITVKKKKIRGECFTGNGKNAFNNHFSLILVFALPHRHFSKQASFVFIPDKQISLTCGLSFPASSLGFANRKRKL